MKYLVPFLLSIFNCWSVHTQALAPHLKVGDLLLQSVDTLYGHLVEAEENTRFSQVGIVLATEPKIQVAETWKKVRLASLKEFEKKGELGTPIKVLRFQNSEITAELSRLSAAWLQTFAREFNHLGDDPEMLWSNFDPNGHEKLYSAELVAKLIQSQLSSLELPVKRLHFEKNPDAWADYFHGQVPANKFGITAADYENSDLFYEVEPVTPLTAKARDKYKP